MWSSCSVWESGCVRFRRSRPPPPSTVERDELIARVGLLHIRSRDETEKSLLQISKDKKVFKEADKKENAGENMNERFLMHSLSETKPQSSCVRNGNASTGKKYDETCKGVNCQSKNNSLDEKHGMLVHGSTSFVYHIKIR